MKKSVLLLALVCNSVFAQEIKTENKEQKFDVSFSYGLSYKDYQTNKYYGHIEVPTIGTFYEMNFDYKLSEKDYIGVGYSRKDHTKHLNNTIAYEGVGAANTEMVFNNYASTLSQNFYDVHYRRLINDNFQITVGVSYFTRNRNFHYTENNGEILSLVVEGEKNRGDNLAAFGSVEYFFRLNKYAQLGAKGKFYYSFDRVEAISILPTLRIQF